MSTISSETIKINTYKLWIQIFERDPTCEISEDFKTLVASGVDVNLQDRNSNNNTALHRAIAKNDIECVKFLLTLSPDLKITNADNQTAIDMSKNDGCREINQILWSWTDERQKLETKITSNIEPFKNHQDGKHVPGKTKVINKSFIKCCHADENFLDNLSANHDMKVLKILNVKKEANIMEKLLSCEFSLFLENSSRLFFLIIEGKANISIQILDKFTKLSRPIIIQHTKSDATSYIYFNDDNSKKFMVFKKPKYIYAVRREFNIRSFKGFIKRIWSCMPESDGNLLNITVTDSDIISMLKSGIKQNTLCLRFLQLFMETHESLSDFIRIDELVQHNGLGSFLAILDLPFTTSTNRGIAFFKSCLDTKLEKFESLNGNDLLIAAVKQNNFVIVEFLLQALNVSLNDIYATTAWNSKCYDTLCTLLAFDSPFPKDFELNKNDENNFRTIETFTLERREFFKAVRNGIQEDVISYIKNNQQIKVCYDENNKSAISVAYDSGQSNIFKILTARGFTNGFDEFDIEEAIIKFPREEKVDLRSAKQTFFSKSGDHCIYSLVTRSRLASRVSNPEKYFEKISTLFHEIRKIKYGKIILEFLAEIDNLNICFDFDRDHVMFMDPTTNKDIEGFTLRYKRQVYIAARDCSDQKLMGVMCQEFMHLIMETVYENDGKPFFINDEKTKKRIMKITENLSKQTKPLDDIISIVFTCYKEPAWPVLMIVRVVHLEMHCADDQKRLDEVKSNECVKELFNFFEEVTVKDIVSRTKNIKNELMIKEVNKLDGLESELMKMGVAIREEKIDTFKNELINNNFIISNAPKLTLINLLQMFNRHLKYFGESFAICVTLKLMENPEFLLKVEKAKRLNPDKFLVIDCSETVLQNHVFVKIKRQLGSFNNTVFVSSVGTDISYFKKQGKISHDWEDLSDISIDYFMNKTVDFQGFMVKSKDVMEETFLKRLKLNDAMELIKIGQDLKTFNYNTYIDRKFCYRVKRTKTENVNYSEEFDELGDSECSKKNISVITDEYRKHLKCLAMIDPGSKMKISDLHEFQFMKSKQEMEGNFVDVILSNELLIEHAVQQNIVIISDVAGVGKSTTVQHLAFLFKSKMPSKWVLFIDLKEHIQKFRKFFSSSENLFDFLCLTSIEFNNDFEKDLIKDIYMQGNVVFLLDGFDEISPHYKDLFLNKFKNFSSQQGNILIITTRPHLKQDLEEAFDRVACKLSPFTENDSMKYLTNQKIEEKVAKELLHDFSVLTIDDKSVFGIPLLLKMVAEAHKIDIDYSKNLFTFFKEYYFQKMFDIWTESPLTDQELINSMWKKSNHSLDVGKYHEIALNHLFETTEMAPIEVQFDENILRQGILQRHEGGLKFSHETVAEFFVAHFLLSCFEQRELCEKTCNVLLAVFLEEKFKIVRKFLEFALVSFENLESIISDLYRKHQNHFQNLDIIFYSMRENNQILLKAMIEQHSNESLFSESATENEEKLSQFETKHGFHFTHFMAQHNSATIIRMFSQFNLFNGFLREEDNKNIFHFAAKNPNEGVIDEIIKALERNLSNEQIADMLNQIDSDGNKPLHILLIHNRKQKSTEDFLNAMSKFLCPKTFLTEIGGELDENSFVFISKYGKNECLKSYCNFMQRNLDENERKQLVQHTDRNGLDALKRAARFNTPQVFLKVVDIFKHTLDKTEISELLKQVDENGWNVIHHFTSNKNHYGIITAIFETLKELVGVEIFKQMLIQKSNKCWTPLQTIVANKTHSNYIEEYLLALMTLFEKDEIVKFLLEKVGNADGNTLTIICALSNSECIDTFWKFAKSVLNKNELKQLVLHTNRYGEDALKYAARFNTSEVFLKVVDIFKELLNMD